MSTSPPSDSGLFDAVNTFARDTPWLHSPIVAYASYGVVLFAALLLAGWWVARGSNQLPRVAAASWAGLAAPLAVALNQPLVHIVHEARPYTVEPHILVLAQRSADFSFPSDHAVMAGAVAAGLWLVSTRLGLLTALPAAVMGFARVYIGAHYPHDVAAGLVLGAAVALAGWLLVGPLITRVVALLARTPARPVLLAGAASAAPESPQAKVVS